MASATPYLTACATSERNEASMHMQLDKVHHSSEAYHLYLLNRDNYQFLVSLLYIFGENNFRMQVIAYFAGTYQDLSVHLEYHLRTFILPPNLTRYCCG